MKNKRGQGMGVVGKIVLILVILVVCIVIFTMISGRGSKGMESYIPCDPFGEKCNCWDVETKQYYDDTCEPGPTPAQQAANKGGAGGVPVAAAKPAQVTATVNKDASLKSPGSSQPNTAWSHKDNIKGGFGGVYEAYVTFDNVHQADINYDQFIVYIKEKGCNSWCARTFKPGETEKECKKCGGSFSIKATKRPTEDDPSVEFELSEGYTPFTVVLKSGAIYKIPKSKPRAYYQLKTLAKSYKIAYNQRLENLRFYVTGGQANTGPPGSEKNFALADAIFDCDMSAFTREYIPNNKKITCCYEARNVCAKLISENTDYVVIQFFSSEQG